MFDWSLACLWGSPHGLCFLGSGCDIVAGSSSYEEIRTVNDVVHQTFQIACNALGLLDNDKEWDEALQETSHWATPLQLTQLFTMIIIFYEVVDPMALWEKHWEIMSEDIGYRLQISL
ncbi:hypothetical protein PTKIN_Ptkin12aG0124500 [Pterospermum kingtungense]